MNIIDEVKEEFFFTTYNIDKLISKYLIKRLGVNDIETINALGLKGRLSFENRLHLLMQIKSVSDINKKKLEIYSKLYQTLMLKRDALFFTEDNYFNFLTKNYPQEAELTADKKIGQILKDFVLDVQHIIEKISKVPTLKIIDDIDNNVEQVVHLSAI